MPYGTGNVLSGTVLEDDTQEKHYTIMLKLEIRSYKKSLINAVNFN